MVVPKWSTPGAFKEFYRGRATESSPPPDAAWPRGLSRRTRAPPPAAQSCRRTSRPGAKEILVTRCQRDTTRDSQPTRRGSELRAPHRGLEEASSTRQSGSVSSHTMGINHNETWTACHTAPLARKPTRYRWLTSLLSTSSTTHTNARPQEDRTQPRNSRTRRREVSRCGTEGNVDR